MERLCDMGVNQVGRATAASSCRRVAASLAALVLAPFVPAADYAAPAGTRPAIRRPGGPSILPGGRIIAPLGRQYMTGPGPFGLAVSPSSRTVVTANEGSGRYSLTVLRREKDGRWQVQHILAPSKRDRDDENEKEPEDDWRSVFMGVA